ncbi:MAG: S1 RNA-binding domain-containing protein [Terracidiphilus sp.]|nr:S1 RNA-binding domain-containing protein [Terracidiphilus sp.]MDR3798576.1 S1 RNA-binding domain-containing protein [Terracidiphilus sp.]
MSDEILPSSELTASEPASSTVEGHGLDVQPSAVDTDAPVPTEPSPSTPAEEPELDAQSSFADALSAFDREHTHRAATKQLEGTVVSISADQVILDIGYKMEGVLPRSAFENNAESVHPGDAFPVSITGRNEEGYYDLSRFRVAQPRDWSGLEHAYAEKIAVSGTVTELIKGGLSVDIGVRAFMPASRSGTRDAAELEALVGQPITCRITKLDVADENVVVDRRVVLEEQARGALNERRAALKEGDTVTGTVRTLMPYGAFVEIEPGLDGLLHISDISRARVAKAEDVLSIGEQLTLRVLKIDPGSGKISLGLKQLQPEPWETAAERYVAGQRVSGAVTRLMDFGAFVELEPGLEGLIHVSEMAWDRKVNHPSDVLHQGDRVDAIVLSVKPPTASDAGRISLGLKQTLADPWLEVERKFPVGSQIEGPVTKIMNFGAFVQITPGIDGLVHVSEIVADRRINHPRDVLREGQQVKALVLAIDSEKRQIKLSMKQLIPTSIDEYIAEHKVGDRVSGRVVELTASGAVIELGEGIRAALNAKTGGGAGTGRAGNAPASSSAAPTSAAPDLSQLSSMLKARWKGNAPAPSAQPEPLAESQIRTFKITKLHADAKKIEVELVAG